MVVEWKVRHDVAQNGAESVGSVGRLWRRRSVLLMQEEHDIEHRLHGTEVRQRVGILGRCALEPMLDQQGPELLSNAQEPGRRSEIEL